MCLVAAGAIAAHILSFVDPKPMHTSILSGQKWLNELLTGHPDHFYRSIGMSHVVF
ncbi:hypothetical protein BV22DRAFT_1024176 [Leucogyrophana mollusca]|uniref:Uncharacterized protein n=1 Tax=Leucogyrophana mollusca TaxID=85980 RepID=A0ACB8B1W9_9AGAM|nr:hypothetical protein BV22DRAFT_1024176 [Leucogyrophana mollusca]